MSCKLTTDMRSGDSAKRVRHLNDIMISQWCTLSSITHPETLWKQFRQQHHFDKIVKWWRNVSRIVRITRVYLPRIGSGWMQLTERHPSKCTDCKRYFPVSNCWSRACRSWTEGRRVPGANHYKHKQIRKSKSRSESIVGMLAMNTPRSIQAAHFFIVTWSKHAPLWRIALARFFWPPKWRISSL